MNLTEVKDNESGIYGIAVPTIYVMLKTNKNLFIEIIGK
jgi:hypothetical protein